MPGKFILFTRACFRLANSHGPAVSRGAGPKSNHSSSPSPKLPPVPVTKSKTPVSSVSPPVRAPSQSARPVTSVRSALSSPAKPPPPKQQQPPVLTLDNNGSGSRESPVVISSGSSSPVSVQSVHSSSRPQSPDVSSISIVKSREVSPHRSRTTSPALTAGSKRGRHKEDQDPGPDSKHPRLELQNGTSVPSSPNHLKDRPIRNARRARQRQPPVANSGYDLTRQLLQAKSGKLKTTKEIASSLGIESRVQPSPSVTPSVTDLVPDENKSELMDRFFSSQKPEDEDSRDGAASEPPSRPSTVQSVVSVASSSELSSACPSRVATPATTATTPQPRESVEEVLAMLPPIDSEAVLAELEQEVAEEEPEVEGLIPAYKPHTEITSSRIDELNNGQLEHIGGIRDHSGEFKEWHEMASLQSKNGELLHILPYSVID